MNELFLERKVSPKETFLKKKVFMERRNKKRKTSGKKNE